MGPVASHSAIAASASSTTADLVAARHLFRSQQNQIGTAAGTALSSLLSSTSAASSVSKSATPSALLLEARRTYSAFLNPTSSADSRTTTASSSIIRRYLIPDSILESSTTTTSAAGSLTTTNFSASSNKIREFIVTLLKRIQSVANRVSSSLLQIATFLLNNPRMLLLGSVSLVAVAGVTYLVVRGGRGGDDLSLLQNSASTTAVAPSPLRPSMQEEESHSSPSSSYACQQKQELLPPDHLCCPITGELFQDPVICTKSGHTYERGAISQWIDAKIRSGQTATCPMTRVEGICLDDLVPNIAMKKAVDAFYDDTKK